MARSKLKGEFVVMEFKVQIMAPMRIRESQLPTLMHKGPKMEACLQRAIQRLLQKGCRVKVQGIDY